MEKFINRLEGWTRYIGLGANLINAVVVVLKHFMSSENSKNEVTKLVEKSVSDG